LSDAVGYTYQQDGHAFYVLNFPSANTTWVYDVATQAWHERAEWTGSMFTRHRANCQMSFSNEIVVGDHDNGNLYAFDPTVYDNDGDVLRFLRSWRAIPTGQNNLKRTAHHALQIDLETGVGLNGVDPFDPLTELLTESGDTLVTESGDTILVTVATVQGANPMMMLRWSDDGGHTWTGDRQTSIGRIGRYGTRAFFLRLGMTQKIRDRVYEISGTDPVKIAIMGAQIHVSPTGA
jgi:hypothetical protein